MRLLCSHKYNEALRDFQEYSWLVGFVSGKTGFLMSKEKWHLHLESMLEREWSLGNSHLRIIGSDSPILLSALLTQNDSAEFSSMPHLVICSSLVEANKLQQSLKFFDPSIPTHLLPAFDVSPYSGLYPKNQILSDRLRFLYEAQLSKPGVVFIATIESLAQKTISFDSLASKTLRLRVGSELPENIYELLNSWGYAPSPVVEDVGQYSQRGGLVDIFSSAHDLPIRIELFGDQIESLRTFSSETQMATESVSELILIPSREIFWSDDAHEKLIQKFRMSLDGRGCDASEVDEALRALARQNRFDGLDFLLPLFFDKPLSSALDHFSSSLNIWWLDPVEIFRCHDQIISELKSDFLSSSRKLIRPEVDSLYFSQIQDLQWPADSRNIELSSIDIEDFRETEKIKKIPYQTSSSNDFTGSTHGLLPGSLEWMQNIVPKLNRHLETKTKIVVACKSQAQIERIKLLIDKLEDLSLKVNIHCPQTDDYGWLNQLNSHSTKKSDLILINGFLPSSLRLPDEGVLFLRDEDILGKKSGLREFKSSDEFNKKARRLSFGELQPGGCIVHVQHGIGVYDGLKVMNIGGVESEFIQISYKDKDKLYLPVYRVGQLQKYSGHASTTLLDKLGGPGWEKTKAKVKSAIRDIANELLLLYAKRAQMHRPPMKVDATALQSFEFSFPYDETEDQLRAINDIIKDLSSTKPMDRLICGDVGFGKTEVAMRAAFIAANAGKQVAVIAPTTVLSFQHLETFTKRFEKWPIKVAALNRFVSDSEAKKILKQVATGEVDILIGTHRLFSQDVVFKNLGLLIVDEEQKFGVAHKEKLRKMKSGVDTLAMSATPIPRTLNMSLMGIRDLSLINTAPVDRLPTRTFISKWDDETIRKSILSEISRGGQIYFIHNRVQSIYGLADELRRLVPEARLKVGHGQMEEHELEKTMISFFHHEIDILVCTTIVESGMDVSRANTMFIDQAQILGLSQLYQLRGRVGRSKQRAYCYLLLPKNKQIDKLAQERLKVIQENTALGSGIRIAQYDLELRGAGHLLGEEQSGHINSVGYELYMDLLNETVAALKGEDIEDNTLEPEINLRIPAMIPENYISDIRIRLSYYKALADIQNPDELDQIENELRNQFGAIPDATLNLMGVMLIRAQCKELKIRDLSAGAKSISLVFTEKTPLKSEVVIGLAMRENKKYSITPDNRLNIRMNTISWPAVYEELSQLKKFAMI